MFLNAQMSSVAYIGKHWVNTLCVEFSRLKPELLTLSQEYRLKSFGIVAKSGDYPTDAQYLPVVVTSVE